MSFKVRLSRVRSKSSGHEVVIYRNRRVDEIRSYFLTDGRSIHERRQDMAGYVLVAWDNDGTRSCAVMSHNGRVVPRGLIPEFVKQAVLSRLNDSDLDPVLPEEA